MPDINYETIPGLVQSTLPKFLAREGGKFGGIVHEFVPRHWMGAQMLRRGSYAWEEGLTFKFDVQFLPSNIFQWVGPRTKTEMRGVQPPTRGSVARRFLQGSTYLDYTEIHHNKGLKEIIYDILKHFTAQVQIALITALNAAVTARDGNYAHESESLEGLFLIPLGWRYWATIDGLHITGDAARAVGGINPATWVDWKNQFINPVAASDGMGGISTVYDLPGALDRMFSALDFESVSVWGDLAGKVPANWVPEADTDSDATRPEDLSIYCDRRTSIGYRQVLFDREDNVGRDQARGRPKYKGVAVYDDDSMGLNNYGYGFLDDGQAAWTDRGGTYASGQWANGGEVLVCNHKHFKVLKHSQFSPRIKRAYEPEQMFGIASDYQYWMQTCCNSRRRGLGYIAGFSHPTLAAA